MSKSFRSPRVQPARTPAAPRFCALLVIAATLLALAPRTTLAAPPTAGTISGWSNAETTSFQIYAQGDDPSAAANFTVAYGGMLEAAIDELRLVFAMEPRPNRIVVYAYSDQADYTAAVTATGRREIDGITVVADGTAHDITLFQPAFVQLPTIEAENQLRHAVSHVLTAITTDGKIPWGFDEGIAQYVERPVNENLARIAGVLQAANQRGEIPSWSDFNRKTPVVDPALAAAESYAVVAYLIDTYKLGPLAQFLKALPSAAEWTDAIRTAYGRNEEALETPWKANLPKWITSDWRKNLIAGFDLEPARALLKQANYAAAYTALQPSLALYDQLNGPPQLADVKTMARQCEIGTQGETLMDQTQQALAAHAYDRAANLLTQAKLLFDQLPPEQQPIEFLTTYDGLAQAGLTAGAQLDRARQLAHSWRDYLDARAAAKASGKAYAKLGDSDGAAQAQSVLDDLDKRQRRIVLLLGALGILSVAWLALWLWARGPSELVWS